MIEAGDSRELDAPRSFIVALEHAVAALTAWLALTLVIVAVLRYAHLTWLIAPCATSAVISGLGLLILDRRSKTALWIYLGALLLTALAAFGCSFLFDRGVDGTGYHLPAVIRIASGWNPVYGRVDDLWANIYPNGIWTLGAIGTRLFVGPGAEFALAFVTSIICVGAAFGLVRKLKGKLRIGDFILCALAVLNPVFVAQFLTGYVDGYVAAFGFVLVCAIGLIAKGERWLGLILGCSAVIVLIDAKTAGVFYAVLFCAMGGLVIFALDERALRQRIGRTASFGGAMLVTGLVALLVVGYRPYVTSWQDYGSPVYVPHNEVLDHMYPSNMAHASQLTKFAMLLFSKQERTLNAPLALKFPGYLSAHEIKTIGDGNQGGGYGPLFSLAFVISLVVLIWAWRAPSWSGSAKLFLSLAAMLFVSCAAFPEPWWARYTPFIPPAMAFALLAVNPERHRWLAAVRAICIAVATINLVLIATVDVSRALSFNYKVRLGLAHWPKSQPVPLQVTNPSRYLYYDYVLGHMGYKVDKVAECPAGTTFYEPSRALCLATSAISSLSSLPN